MPPMVARLDVETSTGNHRPDARSWRFSSSSTMPGSTTQVLAPASSDTSRFRCLLKSMTRARPTVWPDCEVPPPRGSSGTPSSRAIAMRRAHVVDRLGDDDAQRLDLVVRGVGGIAAAAEAVEQHFALQLVAQAAARRCEMGSCFVAGGHAARNARPDDTRKSGRKPRCRWLWSTRPAPGPMRRTREVPAGAVPRVAQRRQQAAARQRSCRPAALCASPTGSASEGRPMSPTPVPCSSSRPKSNSLPSSPWSSFTSSMARNCSSWVFRHSRPRL